MVHLLLFFLKSEEYSMDAISLKKSQWDRILSMALKHALPKMNLPRSFPRAILFGPRGWHGLHFIHPWYRQYINHLTTFFREQINDTQTGKIIRAAVEQCILEVGCPWESHTRTWRALVSTVTTSSWIASLLRFCADHTITFACSPPVIPLLQEGDTFLMPAFSTAGYSGQELRHLNHCRMWLGAFSLADITTITGTHIDNDGWSGNLSLPRRSVQWPRQPPTLPTAWWTLWRRALTKTFLQPAPQGNSLVSRQLRTPLGQWTRFHQENWHYHYTPLNRQLFTRTQTGWKVFHAAGRLRRRGSIRMTATGTTVSALPPEAIPASIFHRGTTVGIDDYCPVSVPLPVRRTAPERFYTLLQDPQVLLDDLQLTPPNLRIAVQAITQQTLCIATDGSFKDQYGTAAGVLAQANATNRLG